MPGRLEVQFESDVKAAKMAQIDGRVNFGIATLDNALEKIEASAASQMFPWHEGKNTMVGTNNMAQFYEVVFSDRIDINAAIDELLKNPYVRTVAPVYAFPVDDLTPDDPENFRQVGLDVVSGPAAWEVEKGSDSVKIAIIDSGVLYGHPDLVEHIWVNPGEDLDNDMVVFDVNDSNCVDNDGNGLDDLIGYDFFSGFSGITCWTGEDCGIPDNNPTDFNGHGTHCAGIAAAVTNNELGVAGLAGGWGGTMGPDRGCLIMCLRAGGSGVDPDYGWEQGFMNSANCAQAMDYAVTMGASAVNCSWGMGDTPAMRTALQRADSAGVTVVHSAGNENVTISDFCDTWEPNGHPIVLSVAWTNNDDRKNASSNYGWWVECCAPGTNVYSTYSNHGTPGYSYASGSSMSSPFVTGLAALIRSHMPEYNYYPEIHDLILDNCDDMDNEPLWLQGFLGFGRINAYAALDSMPQAEFSSSRGYVGEAPLEVTFTDESPNNPTCWSWDFDDGNTVDGDPNPTFAFTEPGLKTVSLTVTDDFGTHTEVKKNLVMVTADTISMDSVVATPNTKAVVSVYLDNKFQMKKLTFPFRIRKPDGSSPYPYVTLDSFSVVGARTEYFEQIKSTYWDVVGGRYTVELTSDIYGGSTYLQPDTGLILKMHFNVSAAASVSELLTIDDTTLSSKTLGINSIVYDYTPVLKPGYIYISVCQRGDANSDGTLNILDATFLINYLYKDGPAPDPNCGNVNAENGINILDVTYLINYLYKEGPPPPP